MHCHGRRGADAVIRGRSAAIYDRLLARWLLRRLYRAVASELMKMLSQNASVLDVGTGPGRLLVELARGRRDLRLVGVDPSEDMVRRARHNSRTAGLENRIEFQAVPAESLPFAPGTFDVVLSTLSAHHWADPATAISEQARVLRSGGQLRVYDRRSEGLDDLTPLLAVALPGAVQNQRRLAGLVVSRIGCLTAVKQVDGPS